MEWSFVFFLNSALLGVGLAMDAFSVSMANGLHDPKMGKDTMCRIAGTFGVFQAVMPMTGWICVHTIVELFSSFETFIPWIALALLGYNQWDANRADQASQDALGKLEETLTETIEDKTKDEEPVVQPELDPEQEMTVTDIDGWGYIGYLSIPSIGLELPVMSEWSYAGLKVAPGRYSGSTYADNMVVCAHNYAKHFSPIKWLALGSEVYFTDMDGQRWSYEVSNVETIQPTDIDKMITASDEDAWDLTLFTCTTGGRARCAVRCTRTGYPVLETSAAGRITE
jgi:sortase A